MIATEWVKGKNPRLWIIEKWWEHIYYKCLCKLMFGLCAGNSCKWKYVWIKISNVYWQVDPFPPTHAPVTHSIPVLCFSNKNFNFTFFKFVYFDIRNWERRFRSRNEWMNLWVHTSLNQWSCKMVHVRTFRQGKRR